MSLFSTCIIKMSQLSFKSLSHLLWKIPSSLKNPISFQKSHLIIEMGDYLTAHIAPVEIALHPWRQPSTLSRSVVNCPNIHLFLEAFVFCRVSIKWCCRFHAPSGLRNSVFVIMSFPASSILVRVKCSQIILNFIQNEQSDMNARRPRQSPVPKSNTRLP